MLGSRHLILRGPAGGVSPEVRDDERDDEAMKRISSTAEGVWPPAASGWLFP